MTINVIGAGTWGIAVSSYLVNCGHNVLVFHRNTKSSKSLVKKLVHPKLDHFKISKKIQFNADINSIDFNHLNILAIPSNSISEFFSKIKTNDDNKFLILSKGFDVNTGLLPSEILVQKFNINLNNISVLSGPNHAEEIIINKPAATIISSVNDVYSRKLQQLFSSNTLRVYTTSDIIGVQLGGAIKNVIAIASGLCVGLKLGDNIQASLVSRGMNEILELSKVYKIKKSTLYGLSGLGDLIATCYSNYSRNRKLGILLCDSKALDEARQSIGMVVEGINTTKIINILIEKHNLKMPIIKEVHNILFNKADPGKSLNNLMLRELKKEN